MVQNGVLRRTRDSILKIEDKTRASIHKIEARLQLKRQAVQKALKGLILPLVALIISLVDPVPICGRLYMRMAEGANGYAMWEKPPIGSYAKFFVFNVTNAERFLSGEDHNLKLEEIGPFTYLESRTNSNLTLDWEKGVLRFIPRNKITFVPELSIGNPLDFNITVPNLPLLTTTSMLVDFPIWTNLAFNLLTNNQGTTSFKNLTVHQYMWGYQDNLVNLAHTVLPGWIKSPNLGFIDKMYADEDHDVFVEVELDPSRRYAIRTWDGMPSLKQWTDSKSTGSVCNNLQGSFEGLYLSPNLTPETTIHLYRKQTCRTMPLSFRRENYTSYGVKVYEFGVREDAFNPTPVNDCICTKGKCLPKGLSDLSPCYYDLSLALSKPHFLDCDSSVFHKIEGLRPDRTKHDSVLAIDPEMGFPLKVYSATQTNIVVKDIKYNALAKPFRNIVFPMFWVIMEYQEVPDNFKNVLRMRFVIGPALVIALEVILVISGVLIMAYNIFRYVRPWGLEMDYQHLPVIDKELEIFVHDNPMMDEIEL